MKTDYMIKPYDSQYEDSWIRCKALSYLYSQFKDQIEAEKDTYTEEDGYAEAIERIALTNEDEVIGILDVGIYDDERSQYDRYVPHLDKGSYMDIIAVHPDYQKMGIAQSLIDDVVNELREKGIEYLTIFTRGDSAANALYKKIGAELLTESYRVKGTLKDNDERVGSFEPDPVGKRILVKSPDGKDLPYMTDSGWYWVYDDKYLDLFDIEESFVERTYVLKL